MESDHNICVSPLPMGCAWPSTARCLLLSSALCPAPKKQKKCTTEGCPACTAQPCRFFRDKANVAQTHWLPSSHIAPLGHDTCLGLDTALSTCTLPCFGRAPALQKEGICLLSKPHVLRWLSSISSLKSLPVRFKALCRVTLLSFLCILD